MVGWREVTYQKAKQLHCLIRSKARKYDPNQMHYTVNIFGFDRQNGIDFFVFCFHLFHHSISTQPFFYLTVSVLLFDHFHFLFVDTTANALNFKTPNKAFVHLKLASVLQIYTKGLSKHAVAIDIVTVHSC